MNSLKIRLMFGVLGAFLGVFIAQIGYWILSPEVDSLLQFLLLRAVIGAIVAMIVGPISLNRKV